ncbi:hypothetical protein A2U01_0113508, partial [Trifolium medium]|nr:hypothetical protein [Trifolium medium]
MNVAVDDLLVERIADVEDNVGASLQQLDAPDNVTDIESDFEFTNTRTDDLQVNKGP